MGTREGRGPGMVQVEEQIGKPQKERNTVGQLSWRGAASFSQEILLTTPYTHTQGESQRNEDPGLPSSHPSLTFCQGFVLRTISR